MDRYEIINNYSKNEFSDFLENDYDGKILELLDSEGLKVLENSSLKKERISYILAFSKYKNEILKNEQFLDLFFKTDLSYYYANLSMLQTETYEIIIDIPTNRNVWTRIDDRARVNKDAFENSKPKDLYQRSLKSFFSTLASKLINKPSED